MLARRSFARALSARRGLELVCALSLWLFVVGCSRGNQTLYIATERPEPLTVTINGEKKVQPLHGFQAYGSVELKKGAEVVVSLGGTEVERKLIVPVEEGSAALYVVGDSKGFQLVDYRKLAVLTDRRGQSRGGGGVGWGPLSRSEVDLFPIDRAKRTVVFDQRAVLAGPTGPIPKGGKVNPFSLDKFPLYRLERVSPDTDPYATILPRATKELGRDHLPGSLPLK